MGIVGAILVSRWSLGLLRTTSAVLLDKQGPEHFQTQIKQCIEEDDNRVVDLHLWPIDPNIYGVIIAVVAHDPQPPEHYKEFIPSNLGLVHVTVEVHECIHNDSEHQRQITRRCTGARTTSVFEFNIRTEPVQELKAEELAPIDMANWLQ